MTSEPSTTSTPHAAPPRGRPGGRMFVDDSIGSEDTAPFPDDPTAEVEAQSHPGSALLLVAVLLVAGLLISLV